MCESAQCGVRCAGVHYYYIMGKFVPEGNISKSETYLWTRGEAEGLIKGRGDCLYVRGTILPIIDIVHNFISRLRNKFLLVFVFNFGG